MARLAPLTTEPDWIKAFAAVALKAQDECQDFLILGDSMYEGFGATDITQAVQAYLTRALNARYKVPGVTGLSYYERNARFAFSAPTGQNLGGSGGLQTTHGLGRRGDTLTATPRTLNVPIGATSAMFRLYRKGKDSYTIDLDGTAAVTITAAQNVAAGMVEHWVKIPDPTKAHVLTITQTGSALTVVQAGAPWTGPIKTDGRPARGFRVIDGTKSNTESAQFTVEGPNASSPPGDWAKSIPGRPPVILIGWLTNDSSSFKRTAAQYEQNIRNVIKLVRPSAATGQLILLAPPQERKVGTLQNVEPWENYIEALYRIAHDTALVMVEPVSDHIAKGSNLYKDGVHMTSVGQKNTADVFDLTLAGEYVTGAPTTGAPGGGTGTPTEPIADASIPAVTLLTEDGVTVPYNGTINLRFQATAAAGKTLDLERQAAFGVGGSLGKTLDLGNGIFGIDGVTWEQLSLLPERFPGGAPGKGWNAASYHTDGTKNVTGSRTILLAAKPVTTDPGGGTDPGEGNPEPPATGGLQPAYARLITEQALAGALAAFQPTQGGGLPSSTVTVSTPTQLGLAGDSLMKGWTENSYWSTLRNVFGIANVLDLAESGNTSAQIAALQGGVPALVTVQGGVIPAAPTALTVTLDTNVLAVPNATATRTLDGTLLGEPVTLTMTKTNGTVTHTIQRQAAGAAIPAGFPIPFLVNNAARDAVLAFGIGRNDFHTSTPQQLVDRVRAILEWSNRDPDDHVLFLIPASAGDSPEYRAKLAAANAALLAAFPRIAFDQGAYLSSTTALAEVGVTPTAQDEADIQAGLIPSSLRRMNGDVRDNLHYNELGYRVLTAALLRILKTRGFVTNDASAAGYKTVPQRTATTTTNIYGSASSAASGVIDVKADYGAKGDGVTDDTDAIQRAFTLAMASTSAPVRIPAGNYIVSSVGVDYSGSAWAAQPDSGVPYGYAGPKITGAGQMKTRLTQKAGSTGDIFRVCGKTGTAAGPGNNNKVTGLVLEGLQLYGTAGGGRGLYMRSLVNCRVSDFRVSNARSGIYMARETFASGIDDEYSYANTFHGVKLTENREWGFECSGTASIGGSMYDVEAIKNGLGGFKLAPTNMTLVGCQAIGNGENLVAGRGLLSVANTNSTSVNSGLHLVSFRSEGNGAAGGYEVEIQSGIGFQITDPNIFPTKGAHCLGVGLVAGQEVRSLYVEGGFWGVSTLNAGTQLAIDFGAGSIDSMVKLGALGFGANNAPGSWVKDKGVRTSVEHPRNVRFPVAGGIAFTNILEAGATVTPAAGEGQLFMRMAGGKPTLYAQFETGAVVVATAPTA